MAIVWNEKIKLTDSQSVLESKAHFSFVTLD